MSIYNKNHRPHYLKLHIFTPKRKKTELKTLSSTGYSISSYSVCGITKTTDVYIDRMILCGCSSLIQKMIYIFKKNKKRSQTIVIDNRENENTNNNNNDENEIKLNLDLSLLNTTLPNDTAEDVYLGG